MTHFSHGAVSQEVVFICQKKQRVKQVKLHDVRGLQPKPLRVKSCMPTGGRCRNEGP